MTSYINHYLSIHIPSINIYWYHCINLPWFNMKFPYFLTRNLSEPSFPLFSPTNNKQKGYRRIAALGSPVCTSICSPPLHLSVQLALAHVTSLDCACFLVPQWGYSRCQFATKRVDKLWRVQRSHCWADCGLHYGMGTDIELTQERQPQPAEGLKRGQGREGQGEGG